MLGSWLPCTCACGPFLECAVLWDAVTSVVVGEEFTLLAPAGHLEAWLEFHGLLSSQQAWSLHSVATQTLIQYLMVRLITCSVSFRHD